MEVFGHPPKFYLKNVIAENIPQHLLNRVEPPPLPEKYPNLSRKVPQQVWN